jgi:membrane-bound lytic murein transglycosylase B
MKKIIFLVSILAMFLYLDGAGAQANEGTEKVNLVVKPFIRVAREFPSIKIVPGESEETKRERELQEKQSRTVVARSRTQNTEVAPSVSYDLSGLRSLYREAASKFGIDWKLIEAVHQVESGKSGDTCKGSYAGATGPMQFMPSTFRAYQNEGSNICGLRDSVFAAANLLSQAGAASGDIDSALFNYNHSYSYVEKVKGVMNSI